MFVLLTYLLSVAVRYLWLNGNELERFDPRLKELFEVLLHLRLGTNPLRCNCWAVWLKRFFDAAPEMFKGAQPPTCLRPSSLKGRHFDNLTVHELRCQVRRIHVLLVQRQSDLRNQMRRIIMVQLCLRT